MKCLAIILLTLGCAYSWRLLDDSSCVGRCGNGFESSKPCQCNVACNSHNDCCSDYASECSDSENSCEGRCGDGYNPGLSCQCNDACGSHNNCCPDYDACEGGGTGVTANEVIALSEELFSLDMNNVGSMIALDIQGKTNNGNTQDVSPSPLFTSVDASVLDMPIYKKLVALYDNYERKTTMNEDHTEQEHEEELSFLQAVTDSDIMQATYGFLNEKGIFPGTYEEFGEKLYTLWFGMYERQSGVLSSSGFEHVFLGEVKNGDVSGFHSWFRWYTEENGGHMNYLGYWNHADIGENAGEGLEFTYTWDGVQKPYGSMMIGTSPELELALYTTCLLIFPDKQCHVSLGGTDVYIQTWSEYYNGELFVGSSYPDF